MKTIGLIGGMSWVSTGEYYKAINEMVNERLKGMHFARCIVYSLNFHDIIELNKREDWDGAAKEFLSAARALEAAGANCILLCANTAHIVAEKIQEGVTIPLIHIADATCSTVRRQGLNRVALLGTRFTMEHDFFKSRLTANGIEVSIPDPEQREFIHTTIFDELGKGIFKPETKKRYMRIIESLAAKGAGGVILACTEIPLLIKREDATVPLFDTTMIHAKAAVDFALAE
jgi:aspartate racemase